jgi:hypothetical protein
MMQIISTVAPSSMRLPDAANHIDPFVSLTCPFPVDGSMGSSTWHVWPSKLSKPTGVEGVFFAHRLTMGATRSTQSSDTAKNADHDAHTGTPSKTSSEATSAPAPKHAKKKMPGVSISTANRTIATTSQESADIL